MYLESLQYALNMLRIMWLQEFRPAKNPFVIANGGAHPLLSRGFHRAPASSANNEDFAFMLEICLRITMDGSGWRFFCRTN